MYFAGLKVLTTERSVARSFTARLAIAAVSPRIRGRAGGARVSHTQTPDRITDVPVGLAGEIHIHHGFVVRTAGGAEALRVHVDEALHEELVIEVLRVPRFARRQRIGAGRSGELLGVLFVRGVEEEDSGTEAGSGAERVG